MDVSDGEFIPSFVTVPKKEPPSSPPPAPVDPIPLLSGDVPAFLVKLWKLVNNDEYTPLISWNKAGTSFKVHDPTTFAREVLPKYFKHSNFASFVRQLNMYGFRKVLATEHGGLRHENEEWEFHHSNFQRGETKLLPLVKRKGHPEDRKAKTQDLTKVLDEMRDLKSKHEDFTHRLDSVTGENKLLWQHVNDLIKKNRHHEQVINKLIQFFVTLVYGKGSRIGGRKRRQPQGPMDGPLQQMILKDRLAIEAGASSAKRPSPLVEVTEPELSDSQSTSYTVQSPMDISSLFSSGLGDISSALTKPGPQIIVLAGNDKGNGAGLLPLTGPRTAATDSQPTSSEVIGFPDLDDDSLQSLQSKLEEIQSQLPPVVTTAVTSAAGDVLTTPEISFNRSISWERNPDNTVSPVVDGLNLEENISTIDDKLRAFQDKLGEALEIDPNTWNEIFEAQAAQAARSDDPELPKVEIIDEGNREVVEYTKPFSPSQFLNDALGSTEDDRQLPID